MARQNALIYLYARTGNATAILDETECVARVTKQVNGRWSLYLEYAVPLDSESEDKSALLTEDGRAKVRYRDDTEETFYITKRKLERRRDGGPLVVVEGEHRAIREMNAEIVDAHVRFTNVSVATVLTKIMSYSANWTAGSCTGMGKVTDFTVSYETVMSALQRLLKAGGGEWTADETTMEIDITSEQGSTTNVMIRPERNQLAIKNVRYSREVVNKMYGAGTGEPPGTIAGAQHEVYAYVGGTGVLTVGVLVDGAWAAAGRVVAEDDSWNTNYEVYFVTGAEAGNAYTITDCAKSTGSGDTLTIDTGLTVAQGDKFTIRDTSHDAVSFIRAGASITSYGSQEGVVRSYEHKGVTNLVLTPALDGPYTAGLCENWTKEGSPTVAEETSENYVKYGASSQKVIGAADDDGISQVVAVTSGEHYVVQAWVYVSGGQVELEVAMGSTYSAKSVGSGWREFVVIERSGSSTMTLKIKQYGAAVATFYVNGVQVAEGFEQLGFCANNTQKILWDLAYDELEARKDPKVEYDVSFVDLYAQDPEAYPYDQIALGDTVQVEDRELDISDVTARITELTVNPFKPEETRHRVSNFVE